LYDKVLERVGIDVVDDVQSSVTVKLKVCDTGVIPAEFVAQSSSSIAVGVEIGEPEYLLLAV